MNKGCSAGPVLRGREVRREPGRSPSLACWRVALAAAIALLTAPDLTGQSVAAAGFDHFYNLEYEEALAAFRAEVAGNPTSADARNHVAQTILYREMFRTGALESQLVTGNNPFLRRSEMKVSAEDQKDFFDFIQRAMELAQARLQSDPNDTGALYSLGVSHGLRANYNFLVRKAWLDSLRDATAARRAHNRATEIDPGFTDARLVQGVYDYVVGSLPFTWRMLGFIGGYRGDRERGIQTLRLVAAKGNLNRADAAVLLCVLLRRQRRTKEAEPYILELIERYPRSFLLRLELVQMYGEAGEKDKAIAGIADLERLRRMGAPGYAQLTEEKIRYARGNLLFWYGDLDQALEDMRAVTAKADTLDLNTGSYAWLRLGQIYDLKRMRPQALAAYRQTVAYAPDSDAAREARAYTASRYRS